MHENTHHPTERGLGAWKFNGCYVIVIRFTRNRIWTITRNESLDLLFEQREKVLNRPLGTWNYQSSSNSKSGESPFQYSFRVIIRIDTDRTIKIICTFSMKSSTSILLRHWYGVQEGKFACADSNVGLDMGDTAFCGKGHSDVETPFMENIKEKKKMLTVKWRIMHRP